MDWYLGYTIVFFEQLIDSRMRGIRMSINDKVALVLVLCQMMTFIDIQRDIEWVERTYKEIELSKKRDALCWNQQNVGDWECDEGLGG